VIAFGTAVTNQETYDRYAAPGIRRAAEPDSVVFAEHSTESLFHSYNLVLDKASAHDDLEALVLLHQDVELADSDVAAKVREAFEDPDVAIAGCAGAVGIRGPAWWQGTETWASVTHRYEEYGGGEFVRRDETEPLEVDMVDGFVMVLSPWAVRELRFDESLGKLHGYDFDICMQARAAGKKVTTAPIRAIHHRSLELISDPENWMQTYVRLAEKWAGQLPDQGVDPRRRALRAEAEAACARALMVSHQMREQAIVRQLARIEQEHETPIRPARSTRPPDQWPGPPAAAPAKLEAIDYAVAELGIESFASLEIGLAYGQYAFYAIDKPTVTSGALIDVASWRARDYVLSLIEQASERTGMRVFDASFSDPQTVAEIGEVDAILLIDVLLRMANPDWDRVLELYAPATSHFVIANPQWERDETSVRLIDLGREAFEQAVPPWRNHLELFDRLDDWYADQPRRHRDGTHVWQWGISDPDLVRKLDDLGFRLERERTLNPHPETDGFVNKTFVFSRSQP
jgi:Glycosyltransferase like family